MRLAWATPFSNRSDIGAHSRCIVEALPESVREGSCLFVNVNSRGTTYHTTLKRIALTEHVDPRVFDFFDHLILNIGNNQENHLYINTLALERRGVVVVHDIVMQHFLAWYMFEHIKCRERYAELMVSLYGDSALEVLESSQLLSGFRAPRYAPWDSVHSTRYPLLEPFLHNAEAVVVHSEFAQNIVRKMTEAPIIKLFLPFDKKPSSQRVSGKNDRVEFVSIGHIGRSKFLHLAIEAMKASPFLAQNATLRIVGMPNDRQYVKEMEAQVEYLDLNKQVIFEYGVSEERLAEVKSLADVFVNVRFPNTESASGSLTEQMACATPVIVKNSGCYMEIPADCVVKVDSLDDAAELTRAMEALALDGALREAVGARALSYIEAQSASRYGRELMTSLKDLGRKKRTRPQLPVAQRHWILSAPKRMPILDAWATLTSQQCARLLLLILRAEMSTMSLIGQLENVLGTAPNAARSRIISRLIAFNAKCERGEHLFATDVDPQIDAHTFAIMLLIDRRSVARLLYLLVLGRNPADEEVTSYSDRLRDWREVRNVIYEFVGSEEYGWIHAPIEETETLCDVFSRSADILVSSSAQAPLVLDSMYFRDGQVDALACLMWGQWHSPESQGVWSNSVESSVRFRIGFKPSASDGLVVALRVVGTAQSGPKVCSFVLNGRHVLDYEFVDDDRTLVRLPLESVGKDAVVILTFSLDSTTTLSDFGGTDVRPLGVFVYEMFVERAQSNQGAQ